MIAYKGFDKGLRCRGYEFKLEGVNVCGEANCARNGFHCAEDPLDVLSYYPNMEESVYWMVMAEGDIDEDGNDSKISCTELTLLCELSIEDFVWESLIYMAKHPERKRRDIKEKAAAAEGARPFAIARGKAPRVRGELGTVIGAAAEGGRGIRCIGAARVDGERIKPGIWYSAEELMQLGIRN